MNNNYNESEKLWAYVHQEMNEQDERQLSQQTARESGLKSELQAIQALDRKLRALMPLIDMTDEDLEKKVLGAWEEECGRQSSTSSAPGKILYPEFQKNRWSFSTRQATRVVLALAACMVLGFGIRNYTSESIQWLNPELQGALQYRSAEGEPSTPFYSDRELEDLSAALRNAIKKNYQSQKDVFSAKSFFRKSTQWIMISKWQELREKSLYVQIEAYEPGHRTLVKEWSEQFDNSESFYAELETFSAQIAGELVEIAPQNKH